MAMSRIYRAPCGLTHRVVKDKYPTTLDAELGRVPEGQGIDSLDLLEKFGACKTCDKLQARPCFAAGGPSLITPVTQYVCPRWQRTNE